MRSYSVLFCPKLFVGSLKKSKYFEGRHVIPVLCYQCDLLFFILTFFHADCRHAAEKGSRVALVGPQEPLDRTDTEVEEVVLMKMDLTLLLSTSTCKNNNPSLTSDQ